MKTISKIAAIALVAAFVVVGTTSAKAATVAELQALIAQLTAQIAALSGTTSTTAAATFTTDLTVGSTGADVTALQNFLASKGFLTATARGYFGTLTKSALAAYQTSKGITPAVGYFGPTTRAAVNAETAVTTTTTTTTTTTGTTGTVSTVGVEGTLSVTQGAVSNSNIYEGDTKAPVLSLKVKAQNSDIRVDRIKLDLGNTADVYNKNFKTIYVIDENGNVLTSSPLNSDTVTKDSGEYYVTLTGINYVVAKGMSKYITIAADVYSSVKNTPVTATIKLVTDAIRGTDGAGIDQYAGSASISQQVTISTTLIDSASLSLSTNSATPLSGDVIASEGTNDDEADKVTVLVFDVQAKKDNVEITDIAASTTISSGNLTNAYLYDGSSLIASAAVSNNTAIFNDINYTISKDTTKSLTIKVDVRNAPVSSANLTAAVLTNGITAENSQGSSVSKSGSATSNTLFVKKSGPVFTLVSKSTSKSVTTNTNTATSTTVLDAAFTVNVAAKGASVLFGTVASGTPLVQAAATYANSSFGLFKNGVEQASTTLSAPMVVDFTTPEGGSVAISSNTATLAEDGSVNITVHAKFTLTGAASSDGYAVSLKKFYWNGTSSTSTDQLSAWRTDAIVLP